MNRIHMAKCFPISSKKYSSMEEDEDQVKEYFGVKCFWLVLTLSSFEMASLVALAIAFLGSQEENKIGSQNRDIFV